MKKLIALVLIALVFAGCTQTPPVPTPTSLPTATPSVTPTPSPDVILEVNSSCGEAEGKESFIKFTQNSFEIIAFAQTHTLCYDYYLESSQLLESYPEKLVLNINSAPNADYCIECIGLATLTLNGGINEAIEDYIVNLNGEKLVEFKTSETMCGGFGGFQCLNGYECVLEGYYPNAAGKCMLTSQPSIEVIEAAQSCVNDYLTNPVYSMYNENSETYWFDLTDATNHYPGCSPACVVNANLSTEINYRCTGLIQ
ncbi:MAG: hypothetical protein ABH803_03440 [Candidatus Micrarchaeota archaeon]